MKAMEEIVSYVGKPMTIPLFIHQDGSLNPLEGVCRGIGGITGNEKPGEDSIGIYKDDGTYFNIVVNVKVKCAVPTFFIDGKPYFYPITECRTICGGLPVIDPATGNMKTPLEPKITGRFRSIDDK